MAARHSHSISLRCASSAAQTEGGCACADDMAGVDAKARERSSDEWATFRENRVLYKYKYL